jgi:hypothetical protein
MFRIVFWDILPCKMTIQMVNHFTRQYIPEDNSKHFYHHFPVGSQLEHRAPFGVTMITRTVRHTVGLLCTSDQSVAEASTYTGQHNI